MKCYRPTSWLSITYGPRRLQIRIFSFFFYVKQHTYPGNRLLFSQRNGYMGKVIGPFYFDFLKGQ